MNKSIKLNYMLNWRLRALVVSLKAANNITKSILTF